jgi:hypothetical protein
MTEVEVCLPTHSLVRDLSSMRVWLDSRRFEPTSFNYNCDRSGAKAVVRVAFKREREAIEFAAEFHGSAMLDSAASSFGAR